MAQEKGKFPQNKVGAAITIALTTLALGSVPFLFITDNANADELAVVADQRIREVVKEVDAVKASHGGVFDQALTKHTEEKVRVSFGQYPMRISTASVNNVDYIINVTIPQIGKSGETSKTKVKMTYHSSTGALNKEVLHIGFPNPNTNESNEQLTNEPTK